MPSQQLQPLEYISKRSYPGSWAVVVQPPDERWEVRLETAQQCRKGWPGSGLPYSVPQMQKGVNPTVH
jgi:hypothetical protein